MTPKRQRLLFLITGMLMLSAAAALVLVAFRSNLVYFYTPSDILTLSSPPAGKIRLGGMVKTGSLRTQQDGSILFTITDGAHDIHAHYLGLLPSLFREGQGVIADGTLNPQGQLLASNILAKHDENYMPPEVAKKLKSMGHWKTDYQAKP